MKIGVIGGGIGGLTTALALQQNEIDVHLYEASDGWRAAGAGIWMSPNSIKVMERLGIAGVFKENSNEMSQVQIELGNGSVINNVDMSIVKANHGHAIHAVRRQTLHDLLVKNIESKRRHTGKKLINLKQINGSVVASFEDGTSEHFDALIGADGLHSRVRGIVNPDVPLRDSNQVCWYGLSSASISPSDFSRTTEIWMGKRRFGFAGVDGNLVYFFAVEHNTDGDSMKIQNPKDYLLSEFTGGPEIVRTILQGTDPNQIIQSDLKDIKPFRPLAFSRVALVGDAGHATTPNMGQGAAQAMESGYLVAQLLKQMKPEDAFQKYEKMRKKRIEFIVGQSWQLGRMAHSNHFFTKKVFYRLMKYTPQFLENRLLSRAFTPTIDV